MKSYTIIITLSLLTVVFTASCNAQGSGKEKQRQNNSSALTEKRPYELAEEFLLKLRKQKTDTIVFYKRTCINCCDFFNIFWSAKGQRHLARFYFDFDNMRTRSQTIVLPNDKIFNVLSLNFNELKKTSVKNNEHKNKDATADFSMSSHYCYAQISVYTTRDSIKTNTIEDRCFDKYTGFTSDSAETGKTNDNYSENIRSKWNTLLITIENEIAATPGTASRELEALRTRQPKP
jgi:hypothetical protein